MGTPLLNSAILYSFSLYFHLHRTNIIPVHENSLFMDSRLIFPFPSMKTPLFMDRVLIFPFPSTKTAISMDNKKPAAKLEFNQGLMVLEL